MVVYTTWVNSTYFEVVNRYRYAQCGKYNMGNMTGCPLGQGKERQEEREKITTAYLVQQWTNTIRSHLLRIYLVRARRSAVRSKFDLSKPSKKTSSKSQNAIKISKHHQNVTKIIMQNKMVQTCTSSQNKQIYKKQKKQKKLSLIHI